MFNPKTERIEKLAQKNSDRIAELEKIFDKRTNVYVDFANVIHWQDRLQWHVSIKRLKQLLDSFDTIKEVKFYNGTLIGDELSRITIEDAKRMGYIVKTKPVKIMRMSIDISSIPLQSTAILEQFISATLLRKLNIETVEFINFKLKELNRQGILHLEQRKCNFDVEIGRDMLRDYDSGQVENFILWSGDSDFHDPIKQLLDDGKKVVLFVTTRKVASELNELTGDGLFVYDIQKIRNFICFPKEIKSP